MPKIANYDNLRYETKPAVRWLAETLQERMPHNLLGVTVVGSSLTEDFKPGQSNINTVLQVEKIDVETLNVFSSLARKIAKKKLALPLLMTAEYIERSQDVFGIELLDFQLTHETVFGPDPFEKLSIAKSDVRLQCERELKSTLIRMRQGYIAAGGDRKMVRDILISTASALVPAVRAILWLKDVDRPRDSIAVFTKATAELSIISDMLITARQWRHEKVKLNETEMENAFESVYTIVDQLAVMVDRMQV